MYHNEMKKAIEKVVKGNIDKYVLMDYLMDSFEELYNRRQESFGSIFGRIRRRG